MTPYSAGLQNSLGIMQTCLGLQGHLITNLPQAMLLPCYYMLLIKLYLHDLITGIAKRRLDIYNVSYVEAITIRIYSKKLFTDRETVYNLKI